MRKVLKNDKTKGNYNMKHFIESVLIYGFFIYFMGYTFLYIAGLV